MTATADSTQLGIIETHRGWTIRRTGDGIICLDPKGSHCLPGGCTHSDVRQARESINNYILADGDAHLFWLLSGQTGTYHLTSHDTTTHVSGDMEAQVGKRDNESYEPTYAYEHKLNYSKDTGLITIRSEGPLTAESALQLANALRGFARQAMESRAGSR